MTSYSGSRTRRLAGASFELTSRRGARNGLLAVVIAALLLATIATGLRFIVAGLAPAVELTELQLENTRLRQEVERARTELDVERATRSELDRQVAELNERTSQLTTELSFYESHSGKVARAN
jgi:septal ring factor EnvC (AmiA/AmiB activator)